MKYFPFFRGKQHEMIALREFAEMIAGSERVVPILEPVRANNTTRIAIHEFIEKSMPFLFICNPRYGDFSDNHDGLRDEIINWSLHEYNNWKPSLYINKATSLSELNTFMDVYGEYELALIYYGKPQHARVRSRIAAATNVAHHIFMERRVDRDYIQSMSANRRINLVDSFHRQRNADYPDQEFFSDLNTVAGNPDDIDFGDFSIVGDHYTEDGGAAHAVALHHVHFIGRSHVLEVSHFISDRTQTPVDPGGKTIEAVRHLVNALDDLRPNNTRACEEYREMDKTQHFRGLGYMKRLAIMHHLEIMLRDGTLETNAGSD